MRVFANRLRDGLHVLQHGHDGFIRNMTAGEILSQVLVARMRLGDNRIDHPIIRNLVFMGMGEPLLNLRETTRALRC